LNCGSRGNNWARVPTGVEKLEEWPAAERPIVQVGLREVPPRCEALVEDCGSRRYSENAT
jgi:hypothetical protein